MHNLIKIEEFSAGFNSRTVLEHVSLTVPERGITCLMGPGGVGKTTLLRSLARLNESFPSYWWHGRVEFEGRDYLREMDLAESNQAVRLLVQKAKLYTASVAENIASPNGEFECHALPTREEKREYARRILLEYEVLKEFEDILDHPAVALSIGQQRLLALIRLASARPRCLLLDEPLRDIGQDDVDRMVGLLNRISRHCAIVMVTHNQRYARELGDRVHLLTAGRIAASADCPDFFVSPPNDVAKTFVKLGNAWTVENDQADQTVRQPATNQRRKALPPLGMHWVLHGKLASMQKPGIMRDIDPDLAGLRDLGVNTLVTLTQQELDADKLSAYGLKSIHFPIVDMSIPHLGDVTPLCKRISERMDAGEVFLVHCKAGLGRTGTILACVLVYRGANAIDAIEAIRTRNANFIQTDEQLAFVSRFESHLQTASAGIRTCALTREESL